MDILSIEKKQIRFIIRQLVELKDVLNKVRRTKDASGEKLKKDAKKNTKIQEIYNENDGNLLYPEFEAMAYEDLPTLASADTDVVRFMHAFKRSTVVPLDQLKKINVIGEEGSLFHEIAGDKRERLETLMGALKLSEWLVSPGTTKVEIERRQSLVEQLRGKENLERKIRKRVKKRTDRRNNGRKL